MFDFFLIVYLKIFLKHFCFEKVELLQYFLGQIIEFGVKIIFFLYEWVSPKASNARDIFFRNVGILEISKILKFCFVLRKY